MDFIVYLLHETFHWSVVIAIAVLPLAVFRHTRIITAIAWMWLSLIFGGMLWVGSLITTYQLAGIFWTVFDVITMIGVVPIALIACILRGFWDGLLQLLVVLVLTFGLRILGAVLISALEKKSAMSETGSQ